MSRRHVSIHLTPFAPDVDVAAVGDRVRWLTFWSVTPRQALAAVAQRLQRRAGTLAVRPAEDALEIIGRVAGEPEPKPLALIAYGLSAPECAEALQALTNGVRP